MEFAISMPFLVMLSVGTAELPTALEQFTSLQRAVDQATTRASRFSNLQSGDFEGLVTASGCAALDQENGRGGGFGGGGGGGGGGGTDPGRHTDVQLLAKNIINRQLKLSANDLCVTSGLDQSGANKTVYVTAEAKIKSAFSSLSFRVAIKQSAPYLK